MPISLTGTGFNSVAVVRVDGQPLFGTVASDTSMSFTAPAHTAGNAAVVAVGSGGPSNAQQLAYAAPNTPTITSLSPTSANAAGGTPVTITGTHLLGATKVTVDTTDVPVVSQSFYGQAGTPQRNIGTGLNNVGSIFTVNSIGTISAVAFYVADIVPTAVDIFDSSGASIAHQAVTGITGTGWKSMAFATPAAVSPGTFTASATYPAGSNVPNSSGVTVPSTANLAWVAAVYGDGVPAHAPTNTVGGNTYFVDPVFKQGSDTSLTFVAPAHAVGTTNVTVTTANGTSNTSPLSFSQPVATLNSISPGSVPVAGGTTVTLVGSFYTSANHVKVDGVDVSFTVVNDNTITFTAPAHAQSLGVGVLVSNSGGTSLVMGMLQYGTVAQSYGAAAVGTTGNARNDWGTELPFLPGPTNSIVPPQSWIAPASYPTVSGSAALRAKQLSAVYLDTNGVTDSNDITSPRRAHVDCMSGSFLSDGQGGIGPLLKDGGTLYVVANQDTNGNVIPFDTAGSLNINRWAFLGGIRIKGCNPDGSPIAPGQKRPILTAPGTLGGGGFVLLIGGNTYMEDVDIDQGARYPNIGVGLSGPTGGIMIQSQQSDYANRQCHLNRVRVNGCVNGIMSAQPDVAGGPTFNWSLLLDNCDFGDYAPNGTQLLAHDTYTYCPTLERKCNRYVSMYGNTYKCRGDYFGITDGWGRWGNDKILDYPDNGMCVFRSTTLSQVLQSSYYNDPDVAGDADNNWMSQFNTGSTDHPAVVDKCYDSSFDNCDIWVGRANPQNYGANSGINQGQQILTTFNKRFVFGSANRWHFTNQNVTSQYPDAPTINRGNPLSFFVGAVYAKPAGQAYENLPALPPTASGSGTTPIDFVHTAPYPTT